MSLTAKYYSLAYNSAAVTKSVALKTAFHSVRLIKSAGAVNPGSESYDTNILLNGSCINKETRKLYVFYLDTFYNSAWIIEIGIDDRVQTVVYYDKDNNIGFDPKHKIWNPRVINGKIIWTDGLEHHIYQIDIERAKKSFYFGIGYNPLHETVEWNGATEFLQYQIVSYGKYLYKALVNSQNVEPGTDALKWQVLCLIEDAYYSMKVENFYFAPAPPKTAPVVQYVSDDNRRINNLKQTLFQFAYRYIYMDWRKSTFSPASIVPLPQAEEETASGLANEQISLNNSLQIFVNVGGEEVRAIEIVARSSDDPSTWFLIETIEKFTAEERGNEVSILQMNEYPIVSITVPEATIVNLSTVAAPAPSSVAISIPLTNVINSKVQISSDSFSFDYNQIGEINEKVSAFINTPATVNVFVTKNTCVQNGVFWCIITDDLHVSLPIGSLINSSSPTLHFYPSSENGGVERSGIIEVRGQYGDFDSISIVQLATPIPPVVYLFVDPADVSGLTFSGSATPVVNTGIVNITITPNHPDYDEGYFFTIYWKAIKNGMNVGSGSFSAVNKILSTSIPYLLIVLNLTQPLVYGDIVNVYLSAEDMPEISTTIQSKSVLITIPSPVLKNTMVLPSLSSLSWTYAESGLSGRKQFYVNCLDSQYAEVVDAPAWLNVLNSEGVDLRYSGYIRNGEEITCYPTFANNGSSDLIGVISMINENGDTGIVNVMQGHAPLSPTISLIINPSDFDLILNNTASTPCYGTISIGTNIVYFTGSFINRLIEGSSELFTVNWKMSINGVSNNLYRGSFNTFNQYPLTNQLLILPQSVVFKEDDSIIIIFSIYTIT